MEKLIKQITNDGYNIEFSKGYDNELDITIHNYNVNPPTHSRRTFDNKNNKNEKLMQLLIQLAYNDIKKYEGDKLG